jgi:hypothetical protein
MAAGGVTSTISALTGETPAAPRAIPKAHDRATQDGPVAPDLSYRVPLGDHPRGTPLTPYLQLRVHKT